MASGGAEPESRQTPSSSGPRLASSSSNRGGPGQDGFTPFFNQLLSNLGKIK
jgi:hypothetical protein